MRLKPMELGLPETSFLSELDERDALEFSPAAFAITFLQVAKDPDSIVDRYGFYLGDLADDPEFHAA